MLRLAICSLALLAAASPAPAFHGRLLACVCPGCSQSQTAPGVVYQLAPAAVYVPAPVATLAYAPAPVASVQAPARPLAVTAPVAASDPAAQFAALEARLTAMENRVTTNRAILVDHDKRIEALERKLVEKTAPAPAPPAIPGSP